MRRVTKHFSVPYYVKLGFKINSINELRVIEKNVEKEYHYELENRCLLQKNGDEMYSKHTDYCKKFNKIFGFEYKISKIILIFLI